MFCPKCGNQLADDAKFCGACGYNMSDASAQPTKGAQPDAGAAAQGAEAPKEESAKGNFWIEDDEKKDSATQTASGEAGGANAQNTFGAQTDTMGGTGTQGSAQYGYGTPNGQASGGMYGAAPNAGGTPAGNNNDKQSKFLGMAIVGVAAIVVIVLVVLLFKALFGGSYKSKLDDAMDLINDRNTELDDFVEVIFPGFIADAYHDAMDIAESEDADEVEDMLENAQDALEDMYDEWEEQLGDDFEISYEVKKEEKLDSDELEEIEDTYRDLADEIPLEDIEDSLDDSGEDYAEDMYKVVKNLVEDLEDVSVSAGYEVKLKLTVKGKEDKKTEDFTVTFIKMNGDWTLDYSQYLSTLMYGLGSFGF